jgi:hypothetical protein
MIFRAAQSEASGGMSCVVQRLKNMPPGAKALGGLGEFSMHLPGPA